MSEEEFITELESLLGENKVVAAFEGLHVFWGDTVLRFTEQETGERIIQFKKIDNEKR